MRSYSREFKLHASTFTVREGRKEGRKEGGRNRRPEMAMLEELFPQGVFNSKLLGEVKIKKKKKKLG